MSDKRPSELDVQDRVADAIWFVPESDDARAHYVLEYSGRGPKAYLNLWLGQDYGEELTTWNWVLYESAVELWRRDSTDEEIIDVLLPVNDLTRERDELRAEVARDERRFRETEAEWVDRFQALEAEIERLQAQLDAAERLIEVVRARDIGTAGGVGAAFEAYDSIRHKEC